jgi:hypothetical protein
VAQAQAQGMSRAWWLNAALLAAVVALAAFIHFKPVKDAPVEHPLSALKPAESRSIRIERAGAQPILLDRKQDSWIITAPFTARADDMRVRQLLEILEARAANRLAAADLARFELERPAVQVTVDGQSFGFGMVSPVTREQYVLTSGAVYAVSPRYGAALPAGAADLASHQLFAPGEDPVRIALRNFTVEQRDGTWVLSGAPRDLSQDDLIRWVEQWRMAAAARVGPLARAKALAEIRIRLKDGGAFTLALLAREPELVLARPDEKLQYHFLADAGKRLLSLPNAAREEPAAKK